MPKFMYSDNVELEYEHIPIIASANAITGTRYRTRLFIYSGQNKYTLGEFDGKLDEELIKLNFEEIIRTKQERQYGQQSTVLRKDLSPKRDRTKVGSATQQISHSGLRGKSILDR